MTGAPATSRGARAVLVIGASGGSGASLIAGGVALAWQRERPGAWLVELDAARGDLAEAWDLPADRTLADLARVADEIAAHHVRAAAQQHASGLTVLVSPAVPHPRWAALPAGRLVTAALDAAGPEGRCVVDGGCGLGDAPRGVAVGGAAVILALAPRLAAVRRARAILAALGPSTTGGRLVLVAGPGRGELGARAVARLVGAPVVAELPWSEGEASELSAGRWPRRRRGGLRTAIEALAAAA